MSNWPPRLLWAVYADSPTGSKDQMKKARILLAFNRASSLAAFRKPLEDEYEIVGTAADYKNLLAKALKSEPDAILVTLSCLFGVRRILSAS